MTTGLPSPGTPEFRDQLRGLIGSLQAVEKSLDGDQALQNNPTSTRLSLQISQSLAEASLKLGDIARQIKPPSSNTGETSIDSTEIGNCQPGQAAFEQEVIHWASFPELNVNPILETNRQGLVLYTNPAIQKLFPDLKTQGTRHPYLQGWEAVVEAAVQDIAGGIQREIKVGERFYLQSIFYLQGLDHLRVYGMDVTDLRHAEGNLRISNQNLDAQRAFLQAILEQLPIAAGVYDAKTGKQILRSSVREELWRFPQAKGAIENLDDLQKYACFHMDGSRYAAQDLPLMRTLNSGLPVKDEVLKIRRGDGSDGIVQVNCAPVFLNGELIAAVVIIVDITNQVRISRELSESEMRYRTLVETSPDAILVHRDGQFLFANPAALRLFGADSFEQLSAHTVLDLYPPAETAYILERNKQLEAGVRLPARESQARRLNGEVIDIDVGAAVIEYQGAQAIQAVLHDITQRKRAEEELRASEARLSQLMAEAPVAVAIARDNKFIDANPAFLAMYGLAAVAELVGRPILDFVAPESKAESNTRLSRRAQGLPVDPNSEFIAIRKDGSRMTVLGAITEVDLADGPATVGFFQDITTRKQVEEALRLSEEQFRRIIETTNEGVWITDSASKTTFVNRQMADMLGYQPEELLGRQSVDLLDPEFLPQVPELIRRRKTGISEAIEYRLVCKNGARIWVLSNASPLFDKDGQYTGSMGMLTDISNLKKREVELETLNRTLWAISNSNQALMHAASEYEFMQEVCQIVVDDCGHALAWIGFAEQDENQSIRPVARAGFDAGYLDMLALTWSEADQSCNPTGAAIRTSNPAMSRNILTDQKCEPWQAEAIKRGFAASIALPLIDDKKTFGAFTIYSRQPDPFSDAEETLLSELANVLSIGIKTIRMRVAQAEAEAALKASETRYRSLFNRMTEGFALHEVVYGETGNPQDFRFLEINPAFERLTGLKQEDVVGKLHSQVMPDNGPTWARIYAQVVISGAPAHFESFSADLQQTFEVSAYQPAPGQIAVIFLNITGRKEMENALRQAQDELEARVEERTHELEAAVKELRVEVDERRRVEAIIRRNVGRAEILAEVSKRLTVANLDITSALDSVTEAASRMIGEACMAWMVSEDRTHLVPLSIYHPDPQVKEALKQAVVLRLAQADGGLGQVIETGKPLFAPHPEPAQIEMLFKTGNQPQVFSVEIKSLMIVPLLAGGEVTGALVLTRDTDEKPYLEDEFRFLRSIADRAGTAIANVRLYRNLEKALQQEHTLRRQLIQAEKNLALNRMVASVAHEINNPIQTIINCLYLLRAVIPPESPNREPLEMASSESRRIAGLVQQLRDLYRPGQDKSMRRLEVKDILEEVHKLLNPHLLHHRVTWNSPEIPAGLAFNGIPDHIKQVFINICLNAVDAMEPDGGVLSIKVELDDESRQVGISIGDSGPGIPPEYLDRIFEPFFTTKSTGAGLGLSIIFDIVQSHGGKITVENQPGGGACFTVWLPVV